MLIDALSVRQTAQPGQRIARGVQRYLQSLSFQSLLEFVPANGLRVDVIALGLKGEIWIVESKSCREDFQSDDKWQNYIPWCDRFFWAVGHEFPTEILPLETGLIIADDYHAETVRMPSAVALAGARRTSITRRFGRVAAERLLRIQDPESSGYVPD